ncbi:hypothetical protein C8N40_111132 [Pontibacter mucosus]|uniref:Uncharacterized protein n=1 Tax=Pontibacter mucosus TaxID=1649266 RepID=A0A2T5YD47_9BACT|nr:hypothetical protein [Pontibacter mucosus]PTX14467.1 hypothetical protein C8N40_111132 [Pontibacter mucosus]
MKLTISHALVLATVFGVLAFFTSFIITLMGFLAAAAALIFVELHKPKK